MQSAESSGGKKDSIVLCFYKNVKNNSANFTFL